MRLNISGCASNPTITLDDFHARFKQLIVKYRSDSVTNDNCNIQNISSNELVINTRPNIIVIDLATQEARNRYLDN